MRLLGTDTPVPPKPDIFTVLKRRSDQPDIIRTERPKLKRRAGGAPAAFTCDEIRDELTRVLIETQAGTRKKPFREDLLAELGKKFGVKPMSVWAAVGTKVGRCGESFPLFRDVAIPSRRGFRRGESAASRKKILEKRTTFSCKDLEVAIDLAIEEDDRRRSNVARILSELLDKEIPTARVMVALKKNNRCEHLRSKIGEARAPFKGPQASFTCEDIEAVIRTGETDLTQIAAILSNKLGKKIKRAAVNTAVGRRCRHLAPMVGRVPLESFQVVSSW